MARSPRCRCRSGRTYKRCCQPWHAGRPAPTPLALMRSRYCAYARGDADYIVQTTAPGAPAWEEDDGWRDRIAAFCAATRFVGLDILDAPPPGAAEGEVAFRALLEREGQPAPMAERSRFVRQQGRWLYHSGAPISG